MASPVRRFDSQESAQQWLDAEGLAGVPYCVGPAEWICIQLAPIGVYGLISADAMMLMEDW